MVQVLALTDVTDILAAKAVLTPAKFALFLFGVIVAVAGGLKWVVTKFIRSSDG